MIRRFQPLIFPESQQFPGKQKWVKESCACVIAVAGSVKRVVDDG
jgi:hypothetical protein